MLQWYQRLADVPRVNYPGSSDVNRKQLPGYNAKPEVHRYEFDGKLNESLHWPTRDGSTSASPAQQWQTKLRKGEDAGRTALRQLYEALELPAELHNYHFLIQQCCDQLWQWSYRREQHWVYPVVESLSWVDIRLVEIYPSIITNKYRKRAEDPKFFSVTAFSRLISLYLREGYVREALSVAERAVRVGNSSPEQVTALKNYLATLEAEGVR
jgi:hypothetical protein